MLGLGSFISRSDFIQSGSLLLDKSFAAGPAAAYSLRRVSSSYSGPAVQIRRASDNVEVNVNFDSDGVVSLNSTISNVTEETTGSSSGSTSAKTLGQFVANASYTDADSLGSTDSALVQNWYDQSGNSNDAIQSTAGSQPQIVSNGSLVTQNGKPACDLNGSSQFLDASAYDQATTTLIAVVNNDNTGLTDRCFGVRGAPSSSKATFALASDGSLRYDGAASSVVAININQTILRFAVRTTSQQIEHRDGTQVINDTLSLPNAAGTIAIGQVQTSIKYYDGQIQEVIIYPSDQSSNRSAIETDINNFYSIF